MDPISSNRKSLASSQSSINLVPVNTPKCVQIHCDKNDSKKSSTTVEFRKSIDKIYDLMKKIEKTDETETKLVKSKFAAAATDTFNAIEERGSSTVQCSDSGTSIKHHLTSSNPSCFSFEKTTHSDFSKAKLVDSKKSKIQTAMVPKVIISTKSQTLKVDAERPKIQRKKSAGNPSPKVIRENPLKAISQLLHEFDYVQKTRFKQPGAKSPRSPRPSKIADIPDIRNTSRQSSYRKNSRQEQHIKDNEPQSEKSTKLHPIKEKRPKLMNNIDSRFQQQINVKRQVGDIMDEVRESRGEAVRGPSKLNSRLNTLAQPKKSYVQAHIEEFQSKYGRNHMSDRLQKLAGGQFSSSPETGTLSPNTKHKQRRNGADISSTPVKQSQPTASSGV